MNIKTIIDLVDRYSLEELEQAEAALLEGEQAKIPVDGKDEGEVLTHAMAAVWCKTDMAKTGCDTRTAVRKYTQKVRNSIS